MLHPRPQNSRENCTWHNFNVVPTKAGYYATVGSYQSGISVFDFSNPAAPKEIAYADPAPLQTEPPTTGIVLGGDWSTYWHNGTIYQSDIKRGVLSWQLNLGADATATQANAHLKKINTVALSNPQTQAMSYAPDAVGADDHRRVADRGWRLQGRRRRQRRTSPAPTTPASSPASARSRTAPPLDTSKLGIKTLHGHGHGHQRQHHDEDGRLQGQQRRLPGHRRQRPTRSRHVMGLSLPTTANFGRSRPAWPSRT